MVGNLNNKPQPKGEKMEPALVDKLREICGVENVSDSPVDTSGYRYVYFSPFRPELAIAPDVVVLPDSTEKISMVIRLANRYKVPVSARGQATNPEAPNVPLQGGILLDMSFMNRIEKIDEENMTAIAEAGCTVNTLSTAVDQGGLAVPVRPYFDPHMQLGAWIASNGTGDYSNFFGSAPQNVVGLEVVLPTGEIVKLGSWAYAYGYGAWNRFPGGPDLIGLFSGSIGAFGIITKVAIRLIKKRENIWYRAFGWPREKANEMAKAVYEYFRYGVHNIGLYNYWIYARLIRANTVPWPKDIYFTANLMQVGESEEELELKAKDIIRISQENGGVDLGEKACKIMLGPPYYHADLHVLTGRSLPPVEGIKLPPFPRRLTMAMAFYSYIPVLKFPEFWQMYEDLARKYGFLTPTRGPLLLVFGIPPCVLNPFPFTIFFVDDPDEIARVKEFYQELQHNFLKQGGNPYCFGAYWPREVLTNQGSNYELILKLKEKLDPNNILNPGQI